MEHTALTISNAKEACDALKALPRKQKNMLAAMQIAVWLGLASVGKTIDTIKANVISFAIEAAHKAVEKQDLLNHENVSEKVRTLARQIPKQIWEILIPQLRGSDHAPNDPLTRLSFTCLQIGLDILSSPAPHLKKGNLLHLVEGHPLFKGQLQTIFQRAPIFCQNAKQTGWTIPSCYSTLEEKGNGASLKNFKAIMLQPYQPASKSEFRNALGLFSILTMEGGFFKEADLEAMYSSEAQRRSTDQVKFSGNVDTAQLALHVGKHKRPASSDGRQGKGKRSAAAHEPVHAQYPQGLVDAQDRVEATALVELRHFLNAETNAKLKQMLYVTQRRLLEAIATNCAENQTTPSAWVTRALLFNQEEESKMLFKSEAQKAMAEKLGEYLNPYWDRLQSFRGLNSTTLLILHALKVAFTPEDQRGSAFEVFKSTWDQSNPEATTWSLHKQWTDENVTGFRLFLE